MSSRRFAGIFLAIFVLGVLPLVLLQPEGSGSAGLSAGFTAPLRASHLILLGFIGIWTTFLKTDAVYMLPVTFVMMVVISALLEMPVLQEMVMRYFLFGAILIFALAFSTVQDRAFWLMASLTSSIAFHMGHYYSQFLPEIASPLYYLLGMVLAITLVLGAGISLGMTLLEEIQRFKSRLRGIPAISQFMSLL